MRNILSSEIDHSDQSEKFGSCNVIEFKNNSEIAVYSLNYLENNLGIPVASAS